MEGSGSPSKSRQTANVFDIALLIAGWAALIRCSDVGNCHVTYEARTGQTAIMSCPRRKVFWLLQVGERGL
jgi:hypothetical protein